MIHIQRKGSGHLETVDSFVSMKEAKEMLKEYRTSDHSAEYYISSRACKAWKDSERAYKAGRASVMADSGVFHAPF
jgi:hypothetical protein